MKKKKKKKSFLLAADDVTGCSQTQLRVENLRKINSNNLSKLNQVNY